MLEGVVSAALELGEVEAKLIAKMIKTATMRRVIVFIVYFSSVPTHTSTPQPSATAQRYDPN